MTKLLIVDDRQQDLYLLQVLLSSNGYELELASNGAEALELARRAPPDMIISDILMPVMDGFSLCRACKEDDGLKDIPFIFYTATYTDVKDEDFAMSLGAERFIVKPTEPYKFLALLRETIEAHAAGKVAAPRKPLEEVTEYYKKYNATLIRKLESKMLQLQQAHQRLAILYQASNELATLKSTSELVMTALRASIGSVDFAQAIYFHYDEKQGQLYLLDAVGISGQTLAAYQEQGPFALGEERGLVGLVAQTRQPLIIPDTTHEARWISVDVNIRSALLVPVVHEQHLLGVIAVLSKQAKDYDEEDAHNLSTLANNLAIAIENARLFEQIQKSEVKYRRLYESMTDAYASIDMSGRILEYNRAFRDMLGYSDEELLQKTYLDLTPEKWHDFESGIIAEDVMKRGFSDVYEKEYRRKDGTIFPVELRTYMIKDDLGENLGTWAIVRDITERKQKERELETVAVISSALRVAQSRAEMLPIILDQLLTLMKADGAAFVLRDRASGRLVMELAIGAFTNGTGYHFTLGEGVSESVMLSGQPYLNNQVSDDLHFARRDLLKKIVAMAGVPLIARDESIGVLWIGRVDFIHENEVRLLGAIADMAANAIQRATLHEQAQRFAHELALAYDTTIEGWSKRLIYEIRKPRGIPCA